MGNQPSNTHEKVFLQQKETSVVDSGVKSINHSSSKKDKSLSRSASGTDIQEKSQTQLLPIEKLSKILVKQTHEEDHVQGITLRIFSKYVFPRYPALAEKLFHYLHKQSKAKTNYLGGTAFRQQCERFLGLMDDETVLNLYVKMYSTYDNNSYWLTPESLRLLLFTAYRVAMDHYSEGPQMCLHIQRTLTAVVDSCFHGKSKLSAQFVAHWLQAQCLRLILPLHRYVIHALATAHRTLGEDGPLVEGIELATPVLEQSPAFPVTNKKHAAAKLLPMSAAWLLAGALSPIYSRPKSPASSTTSAPPSGGLHYPTSQLFLAKLIGAVPSHWVLLYNSDAHGLGANRFLHHVLAYRGPTLVLLRADNGAVFCLASDSEWHESHLYWGGNDCAVVQLQPKFLVIEKSPKLLYLNTTIRGYPQGLRAGKDPRKPIIIVDAGFEKIEFHHIPYSLSTIEVWGCGDQTQREVQLDIKKWQVKEAERQRCVKLSAADWLDHPDRYLLELAGRPQYNNVGSNNATAQSQN